MKAMRNALLASVAVFALMLFAAEPLAAQSTGSFENNADCTVSVGAWTNAGTLIGPTALRNGQKWTFTVPAGERLARVFVNDAVQPANFTPGCVPITITTFCRVNTYFLCRSGSDYSIF